ncbi:MAG: hypothetical protein KDK74_04280 [Cephaloticoccus sp.]|nr:hypothetical protein [Cephaloticoccus sp.]
MKSQFPILPWPRVLFSCLLLAGATAWAEPGSVPEDEDAIVSTTPMETEADGESGAFGQLEVDPAILDEINGNDLVYTITSEPLHGRVGLSGDDNGADLFQTKSSRFGYYAYRPEEDFSGADSFAYRVLNKTNGLVFKNTVAITVKPPPPIVLDEMEVEASHLNLTNVRSVELTTRPNTPVTQTVPSHEDFMAPGDRIGLEKSKVAYVLDDQARPQHGTAKLDRATGQLTYAPNPGFIGEDRFKYYTVDENNPQLGVENVIAVNVEPIRKLKHITADRSRSREVDLVFVINNSPSMEAHQARIAASLNRFRRLFHTRDLDYRIGVLTTDFVDGARNHYKKVRSVEIDAAGQPVLNRRGEPVKVTKQVASNGALVTLPVMPHPWVTPTTPDGIFSELVKVGTNGDSNRTAFTAVYNFVANYYNKEHSFLRPEATTIVVFFMDEEETRMAVWTNERDGSRKAQWIESGTLPNLIKDYNADHPKARQTLDGYINYWVIRPFIIAKGNKRGKLEINAVVASDNISHRRAAELTGGTVLNIDSDFSEPLAALGDRIAETVAVALEPVSIGATLYEKSIRVLVDGEPVPADPDNGFVYDERTHSIRFNGESKKQAFTAKIDITYEEHL